MPNYLKRWINLKKVFPVHFYDKSQKPNIVRDVSDVKKAVTRGMASMLKTCSLPLIGRHHSGIDDARNIAAIVLKVMEDGFNFE